jgi:hypothetical protein
MKQQFLHRRYKKFSLCIFNVHDSEYVVSDVSPPVDFFARLIVFILNLILPKNKINVFRADKKAGDKVRRDFLQSTKNLCKRAIYRRFCYLIGLSKMNL